MLAAAAVGLAGVIYLIVVSGAEEIGRAMILIGWFLIPISLFHLLPMWLSAMSWRDMLPPAPRLSVARVTFIRWIRESINSLLPVAGVGGDVVCARLAYLRGVNGSAAAGSMVVDLTVGVLTQLLFVFIGLILLVIRSTEPVVLAIVWSVLAGLVIFVVVMTVFIVLQHKGLFGISAVLANSVFKSEKFAEFSGHASRVDEAVREIYRNRRKLASASLWRLAGWIAGAGEIWLTMYFFGQPIGWDDALILESLSSGIRAAAFMVPGALGLLEGGIVVIGSALAIPAPTAIVIALAKRVRELMLGLPGLVAWHFTELRHARNRADA